MTVRRSHSRRSRSVRANASGGHTGPRESGPRKSAEERKDFLIQARVPRDLDAALKQEARRRRLSVSHLIRNVLEDTFELVDGVLGEVDTLVQNSVGLAHQVRRDAKQIARSAAELRRGRGPAPSTAQPEQPTEGEGVQAFEAATVDVYAWNAAVLHRAASCARCSAALGKGTSAHLGLSQDASAAPRWLCGACLAAL